MKLDLASLKNRTAWDAAGVKLPEFDIPAVIENTKATPTWVHFGAGNIFRGYLKLLGTGMHRPLSSFDAKCDNGCFSIDGAPECVVSIMELGDYTVAVSAPTAELPEFIEVRL